MLEIEKSAKIKIALTIIWGVIAALFSGAVASDSYSSGFLTFLGVFIFLNLPTLLYWLGFWIWGNGYLIKSLSYPFKWVKINFSSSGAGKLDFRSISRQASAFLASLIVFIILVSLVGALEDIYRHIFPSFSETAISTIGALSNVVGLLLAGLLSIKTYKHFSQPKEVGLPKPLSDGLFDQLTPSQKRIRYTTSSLLVLVSLIIVYLASAAQYKAAIEGASYILGEVIGFWAVFSIIAYFVLIRNIRWLRVGPISTYAALFLVSSFYIAYPQYKEAQDARSATLSIAEAIEQEHLTADGEFALSPIEVSPSNKMAPMIDWVNNSREKGAAIIIDYTKSLPNDFELILTPDALSSLEKIRSSKSIVIQILTSIPSFQERTIKHFEDIERELKSSDLDPVLKASTTDGFLENKKSNIEIYDRYFKIQESVLQDILKTLNLMERAFGTYNFDDSGQVVFDYDADVAEYNALMLSMTQSALLEQEWSKEVQERELATLKKIKGEYGVK